MLASSRASLAVSNVSIQAAGGIAPRRAYARVPLLQSAAPKSSSGRTRLKRGSRGGRSGQLRCYAKHHD